MSAPLAEASVKAVLDFADVDREFAAKLDRATKSASNAARKNLDGITKASQDVAKKTDAAFDSIDLDGFTSDLDQARRATDQVADAADRNTAAQQRMSRATDTDKPNRLAGALGALSGKLAGAAAGIGGLVALGAGMQQTITIGLDYTTTMNTLGAVTGASADQMERAGARARELGNDITLPGTSAVDAAAAMTELAKGGLSVEESMAAAKGTLQLAAAAQTDAATAATIQANALNTFGLEADYAAKIADVLANTANASTAEITDVAFALQAGGAVANQFGLTVEDTAAAIGMMANAGIAGSDAGTLLKSALLGLTDQGEPAQGAIADLGLTVYDAQGNFVGLSALMGQLSDASKRMTPEMYQAATATLFGSDGMRLAGIAAEQGAAGFGTMLDAVNRQGAAADVAAAKTQGLPGALSAVQNAAETAGLQIYDVVDGPLASFATALAGLITDAAPKFVDGLRFIGDAWGTLIDAGGKVINFIREHDEAFKIAAGVLLFLFLPAILSTAATLAAQVITYTALTIAIGAYRAAAAIATAAQWLWNASLLANPIGLIVLAIGAVVGALVLFFTKTELGRQIWDTVWNGIKNTLATVWGFLQGVFTAIVGWVTGSLIPTLQGLWQTAQSVWDGIGTVISYVYDNFIAPIFSNINIAATILGGIFMALWHEYIGPAFDAIGGIISGFWTGIVQPAFELVKTGVSALGDAFMSFWTGVVEPVFGWIGDKISTVWNNTVSPIFDLMKTGVDLVGKGFSAAGDLISGAWDTALNGVKAAAKLIGALLLKLPTKLGPFEIPGAEAAHDLGNKLVNLRTGGLFRGRGGPRDDANIVAISDGEFITNARATRRFLPLLKAINGYAAGGIVGGKVSTSDKINDLQQAMWDVVRAKFPDAVLTSATRTADVGSGYDFHMQGKAIDISGPDMGAMNKYLADTYPNALELFYDPGVNIDEGKRIGAIGGHGDHIHFAMSDIASLKLSDALTQDLQAGPPAAMQGVGNLTRQSSREEIARAIIGEGRKRGYTDDEIVAILSTAIQESNLDPTAEGGGGAWHGVFQQDSSYPGRDDPNSNIEEFFNRLDKKRTPGGDIWKDIFWLQQAPGMASAESAYSGGRQAYMGEIQSRQDEAGQLMAQAGPAPDVTVQADQGTTGKGQEVFVTNWPAALSGPSATTSATVADSAATAAGTTPTTPTGTGTPVPTTGIAAANAWAAEQDFGKQASDWGTNAAKEIVGQFTDPFGVQSLSDRAIDDLRTAAEALAAAQAQQGANVTVNVNGAGDPNAVGAAVVDQIAERMAPVATRYRNGG